LNLNRFFGRVLKGFLSIIPILTILFVLSYLLSLSERWVATILGYTDSVAITTVSFILLFSILYYIGYLFEKNREFLLLKLTETVIRKIPILKSIYKVVKDIIELFSSSKDSYKGVVHIQFGKGKVIGFITNENGDNLTIFVPTTPNPTSGILLYFQREDVELIDMSVEDAFRQLISLGSSKEDKG